MLNQSPSAYDYFFNLYKDKGYFETYGMDVLISFIIIFIFLYTIIYFLILSIKPYIKQDWAKNRCNPLYMPFAGLLNPDPNKSSLQTTEENFNFCVNNILTLISEISFSPLYYITKLIHDVLAVISSAINGIREMINKIRVAIANIATSISSRILNSMIPILHLGITSTNIFNQVHAILFTGVYQLFGLFTTTFSLFGFFRDALIGLLLVLSATIIALWVLAAVLLGTPFTWAAAIATLTTAGIQLEGYIAILIPFLIIIILLSIIYDSRGGNNPPPVPQK